VGTSVPAPLGGAGDRAGAVAREVYRRGGLSSGGNGVSFFGEKEKGNAIDNEQGRSHVSFSYLVSVVEGTGTGTVRLSAL
jgi:hypothetical protein